MMVEKSAFVKGQLWQYISKVSVLHFGMVKFQSPANNIVFFRAYHNISILVMDQELQK